MNTERTIYAQGNIGNALEAMANCDFEQNRQGHFGQHDESKTTLEG